MKGQREVKATKSSEAQTKLKIERLERTGSPKRTESTQQRPPVRSVMMREMSLTCMPSNWSAFSSAFVGASGQFYHVRSMAGAAKEGKGI
jgi:hypothetical protein